MASKAPSPIKDKTAWRARLSAAHKGPRPGKQRVQKAPAKPSWKVKF